MVASTVKNCASVNSTPFTEGYDESYLRLADNGSPLNRTQGVVGRPRVYAADRPMCKVLSLMIHCPFGNLQNDLGP